MDIPTGTGLGDAPLLNRKMVRSGEKPLTPEFN